jgi:hypothetical protein
MPDIKEKKMANNKMNSSYKSATQKKDVIGEKQQINPADRSAQRIQTILDPPSKPKNQPVALTHEQVAERAKAIWKQHGCPIGQDEQNWFEAEKQLKKELGVH